MKDPIQFLLACICGMFIGTGGFLIIKSLLWLIQAEYTKAKETFWAGVVFGLAGVLFIYIFEIMFR